MLTLASLNSSLKTTVVAIVVGHSERPILGVRVLYFPKDVSFLAQGTC